MNVSAPDTAAWTGSLRFRDLERFLNDRSTVAGTLRVDPEWLPESGIARPILWARLPGADVEVFRDEGRGLDWESPLVQGGEILFPVHWWERDRWKGTALEERGQGWVGSSFRTVLLVPGSGLPWPDDLAERMVLKLHMETAIPGVRGNRILDRARVEKCVRVSRDLRELIEGGRLHRRLDVFQKPLGLVWRDRGVLFREVPHPGAVPGFSFWADREGDLPIVVRLLQAGSEGAVVQRFLDLLARPVVEGLLSAMAVGYGLEMHAQNTCFVLRSPDEPVTVVYRDLEGIAYSGRIRRSRTGEDPLADAGPEVHKFEPIIHRMFNRNYDRDLATVLGCSLQALERHAAIGPAGRRRAVRGVRDLYRAALRAYGLRAWDPLGGLLRWSGSPYGHRWKRSHWYRRRFR